MKDYKLLLLKKKNLVQLYKFRSDKTVIKNSISGKKFSYKSHKEWIKKKLLNKGNRIYIFFKNSKSMGTCSVIQKNKLFYFSYIIEKKKRRKGFSKIMIKLFLKKIKNYKFKNKIYARILTNNKLSYKILSSFNFIAVRKNSMYTLMKLKY